MKNQFCNSSGQDRFLTGAGFRMARTEFSLPNADAAIVDTALSMIRTGRTTPYTPVRVGQTGFSRAQADSRMRHTEGNDGHTGGNDGFIPGNGAIIPDSTSGPITPQHKT